jgi:hypothetical protein
MSPETEARSRRAQRTHTKQIKQSERARNQRRSERAAKRKRRLDALPAQLNDNMVLSFAEWCALNHIGERTGRRILASGNGPVTTHLSAKLVGITVRANRAWQASREHS